MAGIGELNNFLEENALLESMFGGTVSPDVIATVIESCNGDVNLAADAIMNFNNDTPIAPPDGAETETSQDDSKPKDETLAEIVRQQPSTTVTSVPQEVQASPASTSGAFRNTGAIPKRPLNSLNPKLNNKISYWPDQVGKILKHYNQGSRILILMRGAAGSGKTYLARHIIDYTVGVQSENYAKHIFSTDSYFMRGGYYQFNKNNLDEAHSLNQRNVYYATNMGVSPIIIDNTNMEIWEMEPYVRDGVRNGYIIEIVEPQTPWARNANQLFKRNIHNVPRDTIRRMLDRYERKITPDSLLKTLKLTYPVNKKPPVKRNIPAIASPELSLNSTKKTTLNKIEYDVDNLYTGASTSSAKIFHFESPDSPDKLHDVEISHTARTDNISNKDDGILNDLEHEFKVKKIIEAQQRFEQFEKVEKEWDNGEGWDTIEAQNVANALDPKPPRRAEKKNTDKLINKPNSTCDDWAKISMFMPPWQDDASSNSAMAVVPPVQVETESVGTGFEAGDRDEDMHKVLKGVPRNINESTPEKKKSKIPQVVTLDKSTSTHENDFSIKKEVCKNKEYHFRQLQRMFKSLSHNVLRDVFETCNCDINWAVDLVLGDYPDSQQNRDICEDISDTEEKPIEECNCLAAYQIVPEEVPSAPALPAESPQGAKATSLSQKKTKKESKFLSDSTLQLKRQIESNVVISDNHYSQHYLNLRRRREVNNDCLDRASESASCNANFEGVAETNVSNLDADNIDNAAALPEAYTKNPYNDANDIRAEIVRPSSSQYNFQFMQDSIDSDTESDSNKSDNIEKTVPVNMGHEFLAKLDELFGREGFQYPENIQPVVNLPMSILQQINAHWAMSVSSQLDDGSKQSEAMIKQDEDFARQLAAKEEEMSKEGKEPDVPTLKEIMDMELAYSIYERNVAEWRNNEPQDLAAKLSREKLYNLFPNISQEVLSEMLMAHDYSFQATIESLIISTGQSSWLEEEKGVEKFVMRKETERKEKFLEEQKKKLQNIDDEEWPYLGKPKKPINLETVNFYRAEAQKSLVSRNANFEKARQYFANNSPYAAAFYSEIAALHTMKYEQSSCLAAAYLMNYHLMNNPEEDVLDLHFLRVAEAMVNLDIFLDQIIRKLRNKNIYSKETWIITGKGTHSKGGPRIKPATKRRLYERGIVSKEVNGGLLSAQLHQTHKMTNELAQLENS